MTLPRESFTIFSEGYISVLFFMIVFAHSSLSKVYAHTSNAENLNQKVHGYGLNTNFSFTVNLSGEALAGGICPSHRQYRYGSLWQPHLVALRVEWRFVGGHAHHCMCPALPSGPVDLPHMEAPGVANAPPDAVGALGYWVPVEGHLVILLGKN